MPTPEHLAAEIMDRCDVLATFTMDEGRITRPYGTPALAAARDRVAAWMHDAGMTTRVDNVGNLFGRFEAADGASQPRTFLLGGHIDSVVDAGRYDGTLGVLTGIAAVQALHDVGERLPFAIEVVAFADEEGNRFHTSFLGSSPVAGLWNPDWLGLADDTGITLRDGIAAFGGNPDALAGDTLDPASLLGFLEVHIEQGPVLQERNLPVATVSGITGSTKGEISLRGQAGHAGTVPMTHRRDALAGAAEVVLAIEAVGRDNPNLVATVGKLDIAPGASNVIPGDAHLTLDLRHPDPGTRAGAIAAIREQAVAIAASRGLILDWSDAPSFAETPCDPGLTSLLDDAIRAEGLEAIRLFSGAGHDAVTLAHIAPVAMLFVRCRDGISHNPAESIVKDDVAVALRVLARFLRSRVGEG
jgi:allantoate deiminase